MGKKDKDIEDHIDEHDDDNSEHLVTLGEEIPDTLEVRIESEEPAEEAKSENRNDDDEDNEGETAEEREAIREARREERKLKKELQKQRETSSRNKITALERRNAELAERLAKVENTAASYQFADRKSVV